MSGTAFMNDLAARFVTDRKVTESTAALYIKSLYTLNGKRMFNNLGFLKRPEVCEAAVAGYAPSTQASFVIAAVAALSFVKETAAYKKCYAAYYGKMMSNGSASKATDALNEKTPKQEAVWLTWDEVQSRLAALKTETAPLAEKTAITRDEYDSVLNYAVLSLYVDIPPRRNADFLRMFVVRSLTDAMPKDRNYFDVSHQRMTFNVYKTAKSIGTQTVDIPEPLQAALRLYLKFHPGSTAAAKTKGGAYTFPLLVDSFGDHLTAVNAITRILGRIFKKSIGSSMLRHFYVSSKYGDVLTEMKGDSEAMAHGLTTQRAYIKSDDLPK
jgi:integrase